jgi:membrane fusion protein (multidrug efflux system)
VASHVGERIEEDQTVALVRSLNGLWVVANVEETEIRQVRQGQQVDITVDAYPGVTFPGKVLTIGSVTSSQFALIPRESVGGTFVKVVQRVPVRISVADPEGILKLGLSAVVAIDTRSPEHNRAP